MLATGVTTTYVYDAHWAAEQLGGYGLGGLPAACTLEPTTEAQAGDERRR